jgi:hypothetical protein
MQSKPSKKPKEASGERQTATVATQETAVPTDSTAQPPNPKQNL